MLNVPAGRAKSEDARKIILLERVQQSSGAACLLFIQSCGCRISFSKAWGPGPLRPCYMHARTRPTKHAMDVCMHTAFREIQILPAHGRRRAHYDMEATS